MRVLFLIVVSLGGSCGVGSATAAEIDASRLFKQLDADRDGQVAADEAGADHGRLFARLVSTSDDDGDGESKPIEELYRLRCPQSLSQSQPETRDRLAQDPEGSHRTGDESWQD